MMSEKEIAITKAKIIHFLHSLPIPIMFSSIPTLTFNTLYFYTHQIIKSTTSTSYYLLIINMDSYVFDNPTLIFNYG